MAAEFMRPVPYCKMCTTATTSHTVIPLISQSLQKPNKTKALHWKKNVFWGKLAVRVAVWHSPYGTVGLALQRVRCEELEACKLERQRATGIRRSPRERRDHTE